MFNNKFKRLPLKPKLTPAAILIRFALTFFLTGRNSCGWIFARGSRVADLNVDSGATCEGLIAAVNFECEVKVEDESEIKNVIDSFGFD